MKLMIKQLAKIGAMVALTLSSATVTSEPASHSVKALNAQYNQAVQSGVIQKRSQYLQDTKFQNSTVNLRKSYKLSKPLPHFKSAPLSLKSNKALVINQKTNEILFAKNTNHLTPIASITKLMTAMVILDAQVNLNALVRITEEDIDYIKGTRSRLAIGTEFTRRELLHMALISSENRAASALASTFPGGRGRFIRAMNQKAISLGMSNTHFSDSTGLDKNNMSTAEDLVKMVNAASQYQMISKITTTPNYQIYLPNHENASRFNNTNVLIRKGEWNTIGVSKTGYIREAGRCLVMQAEIAGEPVIMVFLDSTGKSARIGDARSVRQWVEYNAQLSGNQYVSQNNAGETSGRIY